jgi:hypothetical protein
MPLAGEIFSSAELWADHRRGNGRLDLHRFSFDTVILRCLESSRIFTSSFPDLRLNSREKNWRFSALPRDDILAFLGPPRAPTFRALA